MEIRRSGGEARPEKSRRSHGDYEGRQGNVAATIKGKGERKDEREEKRRRLSGEEEMG